MSFINNLAKGFVRSAVNQVGRDGGKVISNQVYGNTHSTPIRMTDGQTDTHNQKENLIEQKEYVFIKFFWAIIISILLPILGGLIIVYRGYVNFKKKEKKMYRIESQAVYANDKRYSTGKRYEGHKKVKVPVKIEFDEKEKRKNKFKSYGYFIIGIGTIIIYSFALG